MSKRLMSLPVVWALWCSAAAHAQEGIDRALLEEGMKRVVSRIPELETAFRQAQAEGVDLFLYGGTTRNVAFYAREHLREKGSAFLRETGAIPLEDVVGPYSDLDLIARGSAEAASRLEQSLRGRFPEGERFYRWEVRTEEFLKEPWQITQGYEPISKILFGKEGLTEFDWRRGAFGESLTERGIGEVLSGQITYVRNPRYEESSPYRSRKHHEILEAFRYLRFANEFRGVQADQASLDAVRAIVQKARASKEVSEFLKDPEFTRRFDMVLRKLLYTSVDNVRLTKMLDEVGVTELVREVGKGEQLRVPLEDAPEGATGKPLGRRLVVWHGTDEYKKGWSIGRGGAYITTYRDPKGFFTSVDPDIARQYLRGSDVLFKIVLSADAREGVDFVKDPRNKDVLILLSRQAIESIEKPLTAAELGWRLQAALAQGASADVDRYYGELENRTGSKQGGWAAFEVLFRAAQGGLLSDSQKQRFTSLAILLLKHEDVGLRVQAAYALAKLGQGKRVLAIPRLFKHKDPGARERAVEALGRLGAREMAPHIAELLKDREYGVRSTALEVLARLGAKETMPQIVEMFRAESRRSGGSLATHAVEALKRLGPMEAALLIMELVNDRHAEVRGRAVQALGELGEKGVAPWIVELLKHKDSWTSEKAVKALEKLDAKEVAPQVAELLKDSDSAVRWRALEVLSALGVKEVIPHVAAVLNDPHLRWRAVGVLGRLDAKDLAPRIAGLLDDPDSLVRRSAVQALRRLDARDLAPKVVELLRDADPDVRSEVVDELKRWGVKEVVPQVTRLLKDKDPHVRWSALNALVGLDAKEAAPQITELLEDNDSAIRRRAIEALGALEAKEAIPRIAEALKDADFRLRESAARSLALLEAKELAPRIADLINDPIPVVRWTALRALERLDARDFAPRMVELLKAGYSGDHSVAVEVLKRWGVKEVAPQVAQLLEDPDFGTRRRAGEVLKEWGVLPDTPQNRAVRSVGTTLKNEGIGAAQFAAALLLKESVQAGWSRDPERIRGTLVAMRQPMFWGGLGAFSGAAQLTRIGLRLAGGPKWLAGINGAWMPLAAGMAAMQGLSGRFSVKDLAWGTASFVAAGSLVELGATALRLGALRGPTGWVLGVAKLAGTLYLAEWLEGRVRPWFEERAWRSGVKDRLQEIVP